MTLRLRQWLLWFLAAIVVAQIPILARNTVDRTPAAVAIALAPPPSDPEGLRLLARLAPVARVIAVVQADVDRDQDLDLVVTTDTSIDIWINDGAGHYARHRVIPPDVLRKLPGIVTELMLIAGAAISDPSPDGGLCAPASTVAATPLSSHRTPIARPRLLRRPERVIGLRGPPVPVFA